MQVGLALSHFLACKQGFGWFCRRLLFLVLWLVALLAGESISRPQFHFLLGSSAVEQVTVNHLVAGSIPARAAIIKALKFNALGFFVYYE